MNKLSSYDYFLPQELIATEPMIPKHNAKLLVYERKSQKISHYIFKDLPDILPDCDIILNDTKVIKARLNGNKKTGGRVEILINKQIVENKFEAYIKGRVKENTEININQEIKILINKILDNGLREIEFIKNDQKINSYECFKIFEKHGTVPLPPYIKRNSNKQDESWYQSIFAKNEGAVAAPTASLHFDENLIQEIQKKHNIAYVTLHVGAGTFKPVECEYINKHKMHKEAFCLSEKAIEIINSNKPILGVGSTATRCVEEYARNKIKNGFCDLFLSPFNKPIRQDYLITNFHLPKSTLIILVASFIGTKETLKIYDEAVKKRYRFYSYGDGMIII